MGVVPSSDEFLVERLRRGDVQAFEQLFHTEYVSLCAFAARIVASPEAAEDVVQSVFLKVWGGRAALPRVSSLRAYLFSATRNAALDHLKKSAVERKWAERPGWLDDRSTEDESAVDLELENAALAASLHEAILRLPERAQLVITLRWMQGLSHRDIADVLGISVKGVEIQITRALRVLRKHLLTS